MFNKLEDEVRENVLEVLERAIKSDRPEDPVVLNKKWLKVWLVNEWLKNKPWWYLINLHHKYEDDFKEVMESVKDTPWEIDPKQDLKAITAIVLIYQVSDLIYDSDFRAPNCDFYFTKPLMQGLYIALENV